ncbi:MAG: class D beta-lactamase [Chitinophagales bacterium]
MKSKSVMVFFCSIVSIFLFSACQSDGSGGNVKKANLYDVDREFVKEGVKGSFLLYDLKAKDYIVDYEPQRNEHSYIPASTFKILNSLIALEEGVVKNEKQVIKWDGKDRGWDKWNRNHDMESAMKYSAVWFYQVLARKIGAKKMKSWVEKVKYGNQDISEKIDNFWLEGNLRITPKEQINFLARLHNNDLPFSQRNMDIVKKILIIEQNDQFTMRAKTGWAQLFEPQIGWWVGYIETGDNAYFFCINIDIAEEEQAAARMRITRAILSLPGIMDLKNLEKTGTKDEESDRKN